MTLTPISPRLLEMLIRHEGVRNKPYRDSTGNLTIGVGHNLDVKGISQAAIDQILKDDITDTRRGLSSIFSWFNSLDPVRQDVLVDMAFNLGVGGVLAFRKMLAAVKAGEWAIAADEMLDSKWAIQVGNRAKELAQMMEEGSYE